MGNKRLTDNEATAIAVYARQYMDLMRSGYTHEAATREVTAQLEGLASMGKKINTHDSAHAISSAYKDGATK